MKKCILLLLITSSCLFVKAQGLLPGVFISNPGSSMLDAFNVLNSKENISNIIKYSPNQINFVHHQNFIIGDNENLTLLVFNNDKLWQQDVRIFFKPKDGLLCSNKVKDIIKSFEKQGFIVSLIEQENSDNTEKIGEGAYIYQKSNPSHVIEVFYIAEFSDNNVSYYELDIIDYNYKFAPDGTIKMPPKP